MRSSRPPGIAAVVGPLFIIIVALGFITRSPAIDAYRLVDMVALFAAGMAAGVVVQLAQPPTMSIVARTTPRRVKQCSTTDSRGR